MTIDILKEKVVYTNAQRNYSTQTEWLGNGVLLTVSEGTLDLEAAYFTVMEMEEILYQLQLSGYDRPLYWICDVQKLIGVDYDARHYLGSHFIRFYEDKKIAFSAVIAHTSLSVTLGKLISQTTQAASLSVHKTLEEALTQIEIEQHKFEFLLEASPFTTQANTDPDAYSKEELIHLIYQLRQENQRIKNRQQHRIQEIFDSIGKVTWTKDFELAKPDDMDEYDPFYTLYHAVTLLQQDVCTLLNTQKSLNKSLEKQVEERTKKITAQEMNLRTILDNNDIAICLIDTEYQLLDYNSVMNNLFGKVEVQLQKEQNIFDFIPEGLRVIWQRRYNKVFGGEIGIYEDYYPLNGTEYIFETKIFPIRDHKTITGASIFIKDVTATVKASQKLLSQNEELKKVNSELDKFVYSSSHDLRAPLTSVQGLISIAKDEQNPEVVRQYLELMEKSILKLDMFIRDIVTYSKNTRLEINREKINFNELMSDIFESVQYADNAERIEKIIQISNDVPFYSDSRRLNVVFNNLISNAIRYSHPRRECPYIKVTVQIDSDKAHVQVADNGQGIGQEHISKIFDMFYRASDNNKGSGLGLYIVKEAIHKLNGKIYVESALGVGTIFHIEIPNLCPATVTPSPVLKENTTISV